MKNTTRLRPLIERARQYLPIKTRDPREPGRRRKLAFESKLQAVILAYLKREKKKLIDRLRQTAPERKEYKADDKLERDLVRLIVQAAQDGLLLFSTLSTVDIDTGAGLDLVTAWATAYARDLAEGIQGTTRDRIQKALETFQTVPGTTIGDVAEQIFSDVQNAARAESIAVTEITRAYAEAQRLAGDQLQKDFPDVPIYKRWATNADDRVCEICGPLNQDEQPADEPFVAKVDGSEVWRGDGPPAHVNCRCWMLTYPKL